MSTDLSSHDRGMPERVWDDTFKTQISRNRFPGPSDLGSGSPCPSSVATPLSSLHLNETPATKQRLVHTASHHNWGKCFYNVLSNLHDTVLIPLPLPFAADRHEYPQPLGLHVTHLDPLDLREACP